MQQGDANTAYYHASVRQRRNVNYTIRIKEENGEWVKNIEEIKESATKFLFGYESGV